MGAGRSSETTCCSGMGGLRSSRSDQPVRVVISGAAGQIAYSLLPMIAKGDMFGPTQRVILQCLDLNLPAVKESMRGMEMELKDGNFPLLTKVLFTTNDAEAFKDADYAVLLGAFPKQEGSEKKDLMEKNIMIFRTMGHAIEQHAAKKSVKVLVVGNPANTNALITAHYAPSVPKENFFALTRLDHNRALSQIACRANVGVGDVKNVIVWGNHTKSQFPDASHATIKGEPLNKVLAKQEDQLWLKEGFIEEIRKRGAAITSARKASSSMSAARAICDHFLDIHCGTRPGEIVSMGVWSANNPYDIAGDLIYSMPCTCSGQGKYQIHPGLTIDRWCKEKMKETEAELKEERQLATQIFSKHSQTR
eukprot:gnl/TRDRNA2_/TRDRNA2_57676_c0_seq1.p1 gnl/TRDRNA2_/TRDRNA2_57676_c0~~gnl/TRDRNA2_/TRDRNA2_57676_c0_seq1.p1  ORF type:complete len:364 (+),score=64.77 gnl/TRDRNA2_/TRDRNA2_57676_c0_seq1:86-1177(+)